eukprot:SAG31_NODE_14582_length_798_cov_0.958512_1_plen_115_part_10
MLLELGLNDENMEMLAGVDDDEAGFEDNYNAQAFLTGPLADIVGTKEIQCSNPDGNNSAESMTSTVHEPNLEPTVQQDDAGNHDDQALRAREAVHCEGGAITQRAAETATFSTPS